MIGAAVLAGSAQCQTSDPSATTRLSVSTAELESMIAAVEVQAREVAGEAWMRLLESGELSDRSAPSP